MPEIKNGAAQIVVASPLPLINRMAARYPYEPNHGVVCMELSRMARRWKVAGLGVASLVGWEGKSQVHPHASATVS